MSASIAVADIIFLVLAYDFAVSPIGFCWYQINPDSLVLAQALIQRHLWPYLWDPIITTVLIWPFWVLLALLSVLSFAVSMLVVLCWGRNVKL